MNAWLLAIAAALAVALFVRRWLSPEAKPDYCPACDAKDEWDLLGVSPGGGVIEECGQCNWVRIINPLGEGRMISPEKWQRMRRRVTARDWRSGGPPEDFEDRSEVGTPFEDA